MANPKPLPPEVIALLQRGELIPAIKLLRQAGNLGLKEAKDALEQQAAALRNEAKAARDRQAAAGRQASNDTSAPPSTPAPLSRHGLSPGEVPRAQNELWILAVAAIAAFGLWLFLF